MPMTRTIEPSTDVAGTSTMTACDVSRIQERERAARHERMAEAMHENNRTWLLENGLMETYFPTWPNTDVIVRGRWRNLARVADDARGDG